LVTKKVVRCLVRFHCAASVQQCSQQRDQSVICVFWRRYCQPLPVCGRNYFLWVWPSCSSTWFKTSAQEGISKALFWTNVKINWWSVSILFNSSTMRSQIWFWFALHSLWWIKRISSISKVQLVHKASALSTYATDHQKKSNIWIQWCSSILFFKSSRPLKE
jgi:hypothetical protein